MITITGSPMMMSPYNGTRFHYDLAGLSSDTKPVTMDDGVLVGNGSTFVEMDTGAVAMFDEDGSTWRYI